MVHCCSAVFPCLHIVEGCHMFHMYSPRPPYTAHQPYERRTSPVLWEKTSIETSSSFFFFFYIFTFSNIKRLDMSDGLTLRAVLIHVFISTTTDKIAACNEKKRFLFVRGSEIWLCSAFPLCWTDEHLQGQCFCFGSCFHWLCLFNC